MAKRKRKYTDRKFLIKDFCEKHTIDLRSLKSYTQQINPIAYHFFWGQKDKRKRLYTEIELEVLRDVLRKIDQSKSAINISAIFEG